MIVKSILLLLLHIIIVVVFALFIESPDLVDLSFQKKCIGLYFFALFIYFYLIKDELKNNILSFNVILMFGYFIVFFQVVVLQHLGFYLPTWSYNKYWANSTIENDAVAISVLAITLYMLGNLYIKKISKKEIKTKISHANFDNIAFLNLLTYVSYILFFITSGSYRSGVYYAGDALAVSGYFYKFFNASLTASIIIKLTFVFNSFERISLKKYVSSFGLPLALILSWHLLFSLYVGDRGVIISYGLLLSSVYIYKFRSIRIHELVILVVSASIVMTVIGQVRQSKDYLLQLETTLSGDSNPSRWYSEKVPGDSFIELAHSGRTLNHSLYNVPMHYDFRNGVYAFKRIIGVIPGAQGIANNLIDNNEKKYESTSEFISFLIQGDNPTYGDGTSITADIYLDFGLSGIFIGMFLFGCFMGKSESLIYAHKVYFLSFTWVAFLVYFSKSLYLSRASIFLELSGIVLVWLFIWFNFLIYKSFPKK